MTKVKIFFVSIWAVLFSMLTVNAIAAPAIVEAAKSRCEVGERYTGYLGTVPGETPSTDVTREVRSINQQRKAAYADLANRNGVSVEVTARLTAEKLMNREPAGNCVQLESGDWVKK